jgi:hypothetical protein
MHPTLRSRPAFRHRDPVWFHPSFVSVTPAARTSLDLADVSLHRLLDRHTRGDWGDASHDDARDNDWALIHRQPVWSRFELPTGIRLLVLTDETRALTSVLLELESPEAAALRTPDPGASQPRQLSPPLRLQRSHPRTNAHQAVA